MNDLVAGARVEGTITYHGQDIYGRDVDPIEVRRRIGMVFQKPNPFPKSIYDNVAYGPRVDRHEGRRHGRPRRAVADQGGPVGRGQGQAQGQRRSRSPAASSSGCASPGRIAVQPEVILMDEPCSALDPIATARIEDLMHELVARLHDRHRHPQHAAGGAGRGPHRVLHRRADDDQGDRHGRLVEFDLTAKIFTQPRRQAHRGLHLRPLRLTPVGHGRARSVEDAEWTTAVDRRRPPSAAAGIVSTQATTMLPATPHRTADSRRVAPAPMIAE